MFDAQYRGSLPEFSGMLACGEDDPDHPGRYILHLWDGRTTLRNVRRESFDTGTITVFPGAVCRCGRNHDRAARWGLT